MADLKNFFQQLETTMGSGISVVRALQLISNNVTGWGMRAKVENLGKMIENGSTFAKAMEKTGAPFTRMHISFIEFGEQTGCLDKVCGSLADHAEKEEKLSQGVVQSMIYPAFVLAVAVAMGPVIQIVMKQGSPYDAIQPALINLGLYIGALVLMWVGYKYLATSLIDGIVVHIPFVGGIFRKLALARFSRALSVGLFAGVPMLQALSTSLDVSANQWLQKELAVLPAAVKDGRGLGEGLKNAGCIPGTLKEMIAVGEQSGKLPEMLEKTAKYFEDEAAHKTNLIMKLLPAVLFLCVASYVGYIIFTAGSQLFGDKGTLGELFK